MNSGDGIQTYYYQTESADSVQNIGNRQNLKENPKFMDTVPGLRKFLILLSILVNLEIT